MRHGAGSLVLPGLDDSDYSECDGDAELLPSLPTLCKDVVSDSILSLFLSSLLRMC